MRTRITTAVLMAAALLAGPAAIANEMHHKMNLDEMKADTAVIRQSADALKAVNADLSDKLASIADKKEKIIAKWAEQIENKAQQPVLLRQAADALNATNPDLAKKLGEWADRREKLKEAKQDNDD